MDFWQRARSFAEEATKRSQELTSRIDTSKLADVVSEASKRSIEIAAEASKRSKEIASEALKRADQIKVQLPPPTAIISNLVESSSSTAVAAEQDELEKFGISDELREFVKEITVGTFRDFPLQDDSEMSDIPTVSNVRQDLSEWQEKHAKLVLSTVKEVSKLRFNLCPRVMKERKFWRIYFILVNSHIAPYEKRYFEEANFKSSANSKENVADEVSSVEESREETNQKTQKAVASSAADNDLDVFLLGDNGDSDEGPDDRNDDFDDDFDKI